MHIREESLRLSNDKTVQCQIAGNGSNYVYIVGPGSFYLNRLNCLYSEMTFIACDRMWSHPYKQKSIYEDDMYSLTIDDFINEDMLVIKAIQDKFGCEKIGIMGFSVPAAYALLCALRNKAKDIAYVILTGPGLLQFDLKFTEANVFFERDASPKRKRSDELARKDYETVGAERDLSPNSKFVSENKMQLYRSLYDPKILGAKYIKDWERNPFGYVVSDKMRNYYFSKIQPMIKGFDILSEIKKTIKIPILLISGRKDYITPIDGPTDVLLSEYKEVIKKVILNESGHDPMEEQATEYKEVVTTFLKNEVFNVNKNETKSISSLHV